MVRHPPRNRSRLVSHKACQRLGAIDFFAVPNLHDEDNQFLVTKGVNDSIVAFSNTIQIIFTS